jgi:hypothetical protein
MSPTRAVTLHRWQVVAAFLVVVLSSVLVAVWNDYRIDQAEKRITANSARSDDIKAITERLQKNEVAANQATVDSCYSRNSQLPSLHKLLIAIRSTLDDPQDRALVDDYIALTSANTPTVKECNRLAKDLHVVGKVR